MAGHIEDKPKDCRYCYFRKKSAGCTYRGESGCYYQPVLPTRKENKSQRMRRVPVWVCYPLHWLVYKRATSLSRTSKGA